MDRTRYNEHIHYKAPSGFTAAVELAALKDRTTVSEWLRRVTLQKLREASIEPNDSGGAAVAA